LAYKKDTMGIQDIEEESSNEECAADTLVEDGMGDRLIYSDND
jgi:hypothetical protein